MDKIKILFFAIILLTSCDNTKINLLSIEKSKNSSSFILRVHDKDDITADKHNYISCLPKGGRSEDFIGITNGYRAESILIRKENKHIYKIELQQLFYIKNTASPIMGSNLSQSLPQGQDLECRLIKRNYVTRPETLVIFYITRENLLSIFNEK